MPAFVYDPVFWQGVFASVIGGVVLWLLAYVARIGVASVKEWIATRGATRQYLERALISSDPATRQEANVQVLFNVLKWSIVSAFLWILGDSAALVLPVPGLVIQISGAFILLLAMRGVLLYQKLGRIEDTDIEKIIRGSNYRLYFNPQRGQIASKGITFGANGEIGEGRNSNEHAWRVKGGALELVQADGLVHSRFTYNPRNRVFNHTNDADTKSIRSQYIVPEANAG